MLDEYRRRRNFSRTPEPAGGKPRSRNKHLHFVVQKHAARRLHYDFRLELGGVLKSWAVPKGPSLRSADKRLAVPTEDHPLEYRKFEGVIPKGHYGAGKVIVWDQGTWVCDGDPHEGLRRGRLKFELKGEKLCGAWHLVRSGKSGQWLLMKSKDDCASDEDIVSARPLSVLSGHSVETIDDRPAPSLPEWIAPQLAQVAEDPPPGELWLHEIKYDGYRMLARLTADRPRLFSRNGKDWSERFSGLSKALNGLPRGCWLDGEVVVLADDGRSEFSLLQRHLKEGFAADPVYFVFDLLYSGHEDLRGLALHERKRRLQHLLAALPSGQTPIRYCDHVLGEGSAVLAQACRMGLEGVISKRCDRPYRSGRGAEWRKLKCLDREEFLVVGYTRSGRRRSGFGALLLALPDADGLVYAGRVGTGFSDKSMHALRRSLDGHAVPRSALLEPERAQRKGEKVQWVTPQLWVEVAFNGRTADGLLRQASFQGVREDKHGADVFTAAPSAAPSALPLRLTHAQKVLYPDQGLTKGDLADYFLEMAEPLLDELRRRPLTLLRCPDGRHKQCFFQKHAKSSSPESLRRTVYDSDGKTREVVYVDSTEGLLQLIQLGTLELHVGGAHVDRPDRPDRLVFDLDPDEGLEFSAVVEAARRLRELLDAVGLHSWVRTTGGKGLHLLVPIQRRNSWQEAKDFSRNVARFMARHFPDQYTASQRKAARRGKLFIDYLRNSQTATAVASYSMRARPQAPVATPLRWEELDGKLDPGAFSVISLPARWQRLGDAWEGMTAVRQSLTRAVVSAFSEAKDDL